MRETGFAWAIPTTAIMPRIRPRAFKSLGFRFAASPLSISLCFSASLDFVVCFCLTCPFGLIRFRYPARSLSFREIERNRTAFFSADLSSSPGVSIASAFLG
jgi:hypothetical protein